MSGSHNYLETRQVKVIIKVVIISITLNFPQSITIVRIT